MRALFTIYRKFTNLDQSFRKTLFITVVQPCITYCSNIWYNGKKSHHDTLNRIYHKAARMITCSWSRNICITGLLHTIEIPCWEATFHLSRLKFYYNDIHCNFIFDNVRFFSLSPCIRPGDHNFKISRPSRVNSKFINSIFYNCIQCWNDLDTDTIEAPNSSIFINKIKASPSFGEIRFKCKHFPQFLCFFFSPFWTFVGPGVFYVCFLE